MKIYKAIVLLVAVAAAVPQGVEGNMRNLGGGDSADASGEGNGGSSRNNEGVSSPSPRLGCFVRL